MDEAAGPGAGTDQATPGAAEGGGGGGGGGGVSIPSLPSPSRGAAILPVGVEEAAVGGGGAGEGRDGEVEASEGGARRERATF